MGRSKKITGALLAMCILGAALPSAARAPDTWEGLYKVKSKRFAYAYLKPAVDFRQYDKVMIDTPEVAFEKNWQRDYNSEERDPQRRISDEDAAKILAAARQGVADVYAKEFANAGYGVVTAPGPDVLLVRTGIVNLTVNAPDTMAPGRSWSFAPEAGGATLVLEARDSTSKDLLGKAVDNKTIGYGPVYMRNSAANAADFENEFKRWAKISVEALDTLKSMSPINQEGEPQSAK